MRWFLFPAGLLLGVCLQVAGGRFLLRAGLPQNQAEVFSIALCGFFCLLVFPQLLLVRRTFGGMVADTALLCAGLIFGTALVLRSLQAVPSQFVLFCAVLLLVEAGVFTETVLISRVGDRTGGRGARSYPGAIARATGFVLTVLFCTSPFWSGFLADRGEWGPYLAVWLGMPAVQTGVLPGFSFAQLPDIYRIWLGPVCPLPDLPLACLYYLLPALFLAVAGYFIRRRNAYTPSLG